MVQLEQILVADRDRAIERLARAPVEQPHLTGGVEARLLEQLDDLALPRSVEHRGRHRHAVLDALGEHHQLVVLELRHSVLGAVDVQDGVTQLLDLTALAERVQGVVDDAAQTAAGPTQVRLEDLPDVHAARHAQRVEHDIHVGAVLQVGHVLDRHDLRHHTLVAVASGHLVARLNLALHGDEDLDHLHDAGRQLIAALQLVDLVHKALFKPLFGIVVLPADGLNTGHGLLVLERDFPPLAARHIAEKFLIYLRTFAQPLRATGNFLAHENIAQAAIDVAIKNVQLVIAVFGKPLDFLALDRHGALVFLNAMPVEDSHFDDRSG